MPLPMVHLTVAVRVLEMMDWALNGEFLLGNLAPDAIHMRAGSDRSEKDAVHFRIGALPEEEALAEIKALLQKKDGGEKAFPDFRMGYALHLFTDHYWTQELVVYFKERLTAGMPDEEKRSLYYLETDQVDFNLYHQMPWRPRVWEILAAASPRDFDGLLSGEEIRLWLERDLNWFEKIKEEPGITPKYFTDEVTHTFIDRVARKAVRFFKTV